MKTFSIRRFAIALMLPFVALLNGCYIHEEPCYYGYDGAPGRAYFGLDWTIAQPDYVWTDNTAIPHIFQYGSYYGSVPGTFKLYYEGEFIEDCCPKFYYWDVTFSVWTHTGTPGGCGFNGTNGVDAYLMLVCGPYGPLESRINKTAEGGPTLKILSKTDDLVVCELKDGDITMTVTYTRLDHSLKGTLDPKGEIIAKK